MAECHDFMVGNPAGYKIEAASWALALKHSSLLSDVDVT